MNFEIVDSHVHFWDPSVFDYNLLDAVPILAEPHLPSRFEQAISSLPVTKWVVVETLPKIDKALSEVEWLATLAQQDSRIGAVVGALPVYTLDSPEQYFEHLVALDCVTGVRLRFQEPLEVVEQKLLNLLAFVNRYSLTCDFGIYQINISSLRRLFAAFPLVQFVLNHMGKPNILNVPTGTWKDTIRILASYPNVHCKLSGVLSAVKYKQFDIAILSQFVDYVLDQFGTKRILFGGDWPVVTLTTTYVDWIKVVLALTERLSPSDLQQLFSENARALYKIL